MLQPNRSAHNYFDHTSNSSSKRRPTETPKNQTPATSPTTFLSRLFVILSGGRHSRLKRFIEFFEHAREQIKNSTGGFDIEWVVIACDALNAAGITIPAILEAIASQAKLLFTSSQIISAIDALLYSGILQLVQEKSGAGCSVVPAARTAQPAHA